MSVNPNQSFTSPNTPMWLSANTPIPSIATGTTLISTTTDIVTVSVPGLTSTNTVVATYIHPPGGGASQYFQLITPGTNQVVFNMAVNTASGESINWITKLS
jgi:hypothetical protein